MMGTMLFNGHILPVINCVVEAHDMSKPETEIPDRLLLPLGPEPTSEEGRKLRRQIELRNQSRREAWKASDVGDSLLQYLEGRSSVEICIEFPEFRWESVKFSVRNEDVPTVARILSGKFDSWFMLLPDGAAIPGRLTKNNRDAVIADIGEKLDAIIKLQDEMLPHVKGVPPLVEASNETLREAMAEFYRRLYAPGFTPKQKAIADAMLETGNHVRQCTPILKRNGWEGVSPGRISIELGKMDKLYAAAGMTNPFASRGHNRARPVADITYRKRKVDSDDPDSPVELVPNRPEGYRKGET